MKFDLEKIFEESKRTAKAYSQQVKGILHIVKTTWCRLLILVLMSLRKAGDVSSGKRRRGCGF